MEFKIDDDKIMVIRAVATKPPRRPWWWWIKMRWNKPSEMLTEFEQSTFADYEPAKMHSADDAFITDRRPRIVRK